MNVYIWQSGYGGYHVVVVAESVDEAREKYNIQLESAKELELRMDKVDYLSDEWLKLDDERNKIAFGGGFYSSADIMDDEPTYILKESGSLTDAVCLLGNDV